MKNHIMISTEKLQNYQIYHQVKLIDMNIVQVRKYDLLIKVQWKEQANFAYSPLRKTFEKQIKTIKNETILIKPNKSN